MKILRFYDPSECDDRGVPLDWEQCRVCRGSGQVAALGAMVGDPACTCSSCDGHGSLKAAALHEWRMTINVTFEIPDDWAGETITATNATKELPRDVRCESCNHPMSDGTWEGGPWVQPNDPAWCLQLALMFLRDGDEPQVLSSSRGDFVTHYTACDEGCVHGGPTRGHLAEDPTKTFISTPSPRNHETGGWVAVGYELEASWRDVDLRTLGWPHDLRPEKLTVLCRRCWAER